MGINGHNKFMEMAEQLAGEIRGMQSGDKLPTAAELATRFSTSIATASKVIKELQIRGLIQSKRGVGSIVSSNRPRKFIICVEPLGVPDISQHWWLFQSSLNSSCLREYENYTVITVSGEKLEEEVQSLLNRSQQIDGAVFFRESCLYEEHFNFLKQHGIPAVFFGSSSFRNILRDGCGCFFEESEIVSLAVRHLYQAGHREIGCIYDRESSLDRTRLEMYFKELENCGLPARKEFTLDTEGLNYLWFDQMMTSTEKRRQFRNYLSQISGLVILHDNQAAIIMQYIKELGFDIPEDLSIVSIDNLPICERMRPQLDSISIDIYDNARLCLEMLRKFHSTPGSYSTRVPVSLKKRNSVQIINRQN